MNQANPEDEILTERRGHAVIVTLNRPKVLNALSVDMIRALLAGLDEWEGDDTVETVLIRGAGDRAFCAGGDVKEFHRAGREDPQGAIRYFALEYTLDRRLFHYPKPVVAFMNGITMGGGFGIAGNCRQRIATENTVFAMPETKIGFFPDVGSVYHLLRCPDHVGWYLALTGNAAGPRDIIDCGLADAFIPLAQEEALIMLLAKGKDSARLQEEPPGEAALAVHRSSIEKVFSHENLQGILQALEEENSDFARETLATIRSRSPTSVAIACEQMRRAQGADFDTVIETDFTLVQNVMKGRDMYEGIRAVILDKDNVPRWSPARLEDIRENDVKEYFRSGAYNLNDIQISSV